MLYIGFGKFKELKAGEFKKWFANESNVNALKNALPKGAKYVGAYFVVGGHHEHDYEIVYDIDNFAVLDTWDNHEPWMKLIEGIVGELGLLFTWGRTRFLKPVVETRLIDAEKFKKD